MDIVYILKKKNSVSVEVDSLLRCVTAHRSTLNLQRHVEQFLGSLVQKVGVQHSDFTDIPQPDLRRWSPKTFSDLEYAKKVNCSQVQNK